MSAPAPATWLPISSASALDGASRRRGTVVSSSRKPIATAEAESAASSSGWSTRFVTWAWIDGVLRTRSFVIAVSSSTGVIRERMRACLAGVMPRASRTHSPRAIAGSTSMRANARSSAAIASSATGMSMAWRAMNSSIRSNSCSARPSSSTILPSAILMDGSGSSGPAIAIRPSSGISGTIASMLMGRVA